MANLKLNNITVATETDGIATLQSGIFKAADGSAAFTIADSTGLVTLSGNLTTANIFPAADNTSNLGSATKKWGGIWTDDIVVSGTNAPFTTNSGDVVVNKNKKLKQQGAFMQSSTHQSIVLGG